MHGKQYHPATHPPLILTAMFSAPIFMNAIRKNQKRTVAMITQKPISLKIDTELLENLDNECTRTWRKRNWCINQAISYYLEIMELRRICRNLGNDEMNKKALLQKFLRERIPEAATW